MSTPEEDARLGQDYLEKAVLGVLLQAAHNKKCIGPAEISKSARIFRERGDADIINDAIVIGILVKLNTEGKVERCTQQDNQRGGWQLTQK